MDAAADALVLVALALRSGLAPVEALEAVAEKSPAAVAHQLRVVASAHRWGQDAATAWSHVGHAWRPAALAWQAAERSGAAPAGVVLAAAAIVLSRVQQERQAAVVLGLVASVYGGVAGHLFADGAALEGMGAAYVGLGVLGVSLAVVIGLDDGRPLLAPAVLLGSLLSIGGWVFDVTDLRAPEVLTGVLVFVVILKDLVKRPLPSSGFVICGWRSGTSSETLETASLLATRLTGVFGEQLEIVLVDLKVLFVLLSLFLSAPSTLSACFAVFFLFLCSGESIEKHWTCFIGRIISKVLHQ